MRIACKDAGRRAITDMAEEIKKDAETAAEETTGKEQETTAKTTEAEAADKTAEAEAEDSAKVENDKADAENADDAGKDPDKADGKAETASDADDRKKSGFFSKKKKPSAEEKALAEAKEQNAALKDQLQRLMAEFDNYRKRTDREKEQQFSMGEADVIKKLLPVVDNFERGFSMVTDEDKDDAFVAGMHKVYDQMTKQLADLGVKPIECVGKPFDPAFHNAVMQTTSGEYESGTVAQELQKGYLYHDTVLRHSMVSVVQ